MTAEEFVAAHPDSAEWTVADIETFENLHDVDALTTQPNYAPAA
jgi:hypothetical protein